MDKGIYVGQVFGIQIRVHWSWLLLFALTTWNVGMLFGQLGPEWGDTTRWATAAGASLAFFACVLAHEVAHALVARRDRLPVQSITLFFFGGMSKLQSEPALPGHKFAVALAGPLTNLALGGALLGLAHAGAA